MGGFFSTNLISFTGIVALAVLGAGCKKPALPPPPKIDPNAGYTWKACENPALGYQTVSSELKPECLPEVIYSWANSESIETVALASTPQKVLPWNGLLYAWRTPMGSFGYGNLFMRIKLKPETQFVFLGPNLPACDDPQIAAQKNQVYIRSDLRLARDFETEETFRFSWSEYLLCDSSAVESWSYGFSQNVEELYREWSWVSQHTPEEYDGFYRKNGDPVFFDHHFDLLLGAVWTVEKLQENYLFIQDFVTQKKGKVLFAEGVNPSIEEHFTVTNPNYINPGFIPASTEQP